MTIINGIEIDIIEAPMDEIRSALLNNEPIDTELHVIAVISNPCQYARRYILAREFIQRIGQDANVKLYVVELAYGDQKFYVTDPKNKRHLQIRGSVPLWHKENMINMGIRTLLPKGWKACAWIDADIEFENPGWALDTLKILNGCKDIVQPFSHAIDMDRQKNALNIFPSFCYQFSKKRPHGLIGVNMWHPGFAWACTRKAYERMGGLYEVSILGSGDHIMSLAFVGLSHTSLNGTVHPDYLETAQVFQDRASSFRLGYTPGLIRHHFHGAKKNRKYGDRWQILVKHAFAPTVHLTKREDGLLVPSPACPRELLTDIMSYFAERNEDEGYKVVII